MSIERQATHKNIILTIKLTESVGLFDGELEGLGVTGLWLGEDVTGASLGCSVWKYKKC